MRRDGTSGSGGNPLLATRRDVLALAALGMAGAAAQPAKAASPSGQITYGVHITLAPTWLDPAETAGIITPFMVLYALHDAVAKPMPQGNPAPSLAESWSGGEDGLSYEFVLRKDAKFHNGDPVTADDVKFSFERYRGAAHALLKERVATVETPDPQRVVFKLKTPWPDFITFYAVASGAGWVVPTQVCGEGRGRRVQEGPDWRRAIQVRVVHARRGAGAGGFRAVLAQDTEREADRDARDTRRVDATGRAQARRDRHRLLGARRACRGAAAHAGADIEADGGIGAVFSVFPRAVGSEVAVERCTGAAGSQSGARSQHDQPGADARAFAHHRQRHPGELRVLREAAAGGVRSGKGEGASSGGGPRRWFRRGFLHLRRCLREPRRGGAQLPHGGRHSRAAAAVGACGVLQGLWRQEVQEHHPGVRAARSAMPRRGFRNSSSRVAPTPMAATPRSTSCSRSRRSNWIGSKRAAILAKMQQLLHERTMYVPIWQLAFISGVGPRVDQSGFGLIKGFVYTAPYEEITLKSA